MRHGRVLEPAAQLCGGRAAGGPSSSFAAARAPQGGRVRVRTHLPPLQRSRALPAPWVAPVNRLPVCMAALLVASLKEDVLAADMVA